MVSLLLAKRIGILLVELFKRTVPIGPQSSD